MFGEGLIQLGARKRAAKKIVRREVNRNLVCMAVSF